MVTTVLTGVISGIDAHPVMVEVDLPSGIPGLTIVGLPDTTVNESKERLKSAIKNSGFPFPMKKVLLNLAPAGLRKEGTAFDLPMALGILLASESLTHVPFLEATGFIGELSLDGSLRPVSGVLSLALMAKENGWSGLVVPEENMMEASLVEGLAVYGIKRLGDLPLLLLHPPSFQKPFDRAQYIQSQCQLQGGSGLDFSHIKGQVAAKRAMEIAAAGGHNVLMAGPPGSGKSMLAKALPSILPAMAFEEMLEVSRIYSVSGLLPREQSLMVSRPYRAPHHSASLAGLAGGGTNPRPGEITLAHRGVLFLDEVVEFPRNIIEMLRQPLEDGTVTISRVHQNITYPAKFMLVAALNPCPCGYRGDSTRRCTCSDLQIQRYVAKLSGPILDRIDLHLEVPRLSEEELLVDAKPQKDDVLVETSSQVRARVEVARSIQLKRFEGLGIYCNGEMTPQQVREFCPLDEGCQELLRRAVKRYQFSARVFDRLIRLARTMADLEGAETIEIGHLAEAIQYRALPLLQTSDVSVSP